MGKRIRRLMVGLAVILVSLTGLLAVSALVPDVGCQTRTPDMFQTFTRIQVSLPERAYVGQPFTVNGTLERGAKPWNPSKPESIPMEPFALQRVLVKSPFFLEQVLTDDEGRFSANITPQVPGSYRVEAKYPGDSMMYYLDSADGREVTFVGQSTAARPTDLSWIRFAIVIPVLLLAAYLLYREITALSRRSREKSERRADRHRRFGEWARALRWVAALLVLATVLFAIVPRSPAVVHKGEGSDRITTAVRLTVPARVKPGESFEAKGRLNKVEDGRRLPMPDAKVDIFVVTISGQSDIQEVVATLTTDDEGEFTTATVLHYGGVYEVSAVFRETGDMYLESSDVRNVTVGGPGETFGDWKSPGWFSVILGAPLAILIAIGAFLYYRHYRRTHPREPQKPKTQVVAQVLASPPTPTRVLASDSPVKIALPQIPEQFPDVWGQDESLMIIFAVDGAQHPLEQYSLDIEVAPDSTVRARLGRDGRASQAHSYSVTGQYEIKAVLVKEVRNGYLAASRSVRIVDYREEVVRLYNGMLAILKTRGFSLSKEMTAREVESKLVRAMPELSTQTVAGLVSAFEEANYSLHRIARPAYERMYLATLEVEKYARK